MGGQRDSIPFTIWQMAGATEHLGGIYATRRLLAMCPIRPGQLLDGRQECGLCAYQYHRPR